MINIGNSSVVFEIVCIILYVYACVCVCVCVYGIHVLRVYVTNM